MSKQFEQFGKYILLEKLAAGGMAEVFLARAQGANGIGKFLAIKRILPQFSDNDDFIDMFKDEAKIAINLSHSNIVPIFEFGISSNQLFLVMAYIEGRNLRQILNRMKKVKKFFSIEQVIYICKEIASGLDHAHRCLDGTTGKSLSITHRDMSPQNVMISFEGEVKVIDFGIAKAETQLDTTRAGTLKGKFGYMSPEQAEGQPIDLRTDIFSLGIVLWELLANDRLFIANNEINTLRKIRDCRVPSLRKINPNVSPELEKIVYKALARDRNLRYQTASALQRDLNRFLNRQYPDFAPQDFAGAVKSLYTDEILDNRKRLITYARRTSELQDAQIANGDSAPNLDNANSTCEVGSADPNNLAHQLSEINAQMVDKSSPRDLSFDQANLDVEKIMNEIKKVSHTKPSSPRRKNYGSQENFTQSRFNKTPLGGSDSGIKNNSSSAFKFIAVAAVLIIGLFLANQIFPSTMAPIRKVAASLGLIKVNSTVLTSTSPTQPTTTTQVKPRPTPVNNIESSHLPTPPKQVAVAEKFRVSIKSSPSGASIFINNVNTYRHTPSLVSVPSSGVTITLKKTGYDHFKIKNPKIDAKNRTIKVSLSLAKIAYLNIDILPPVPTNIYINGSQLIGKSFPIMKYPVPANQDIVVRAVSPTTGKSITKKFRLRDRQSKRLTFNLTRRPAGRRK